MNESKLLWYGEPVDGKSKEELIEIIRQLLRMNESTALRAANDLRRVSEILGQRGKD